MFYEESEHFIECENQPADKECICLEIKEDRYWEKINNQVDDIAIDLL